MIYSTMKNKAMSVQKFQNTLGNIRDQLNLEKASSQAKDNRIKSFEDLIIEVGYDPTNVKVADELIKKKNADIAALKKQLKLPHNEHPEENEVLQDANQKYEMMNLIFQLTTQIKEMEIEMDKLVQEKEASKEAVPVTVIPVVNTVVPSTLVESLAPTVPMATTLLVTSATTSTTKSSTTAVQPTDEASKLIKSMQDMYIQTNEINRLKEQLKILEDEKKLAKIMHKNEDQSSQTGQ